MFRRSKSSACKGKPCPWCRMEQSSPGFVAFNSNKTATFIPTQIDVSQVAAIINAIRDPGPSPNIQTALVVPTNLIPDNTKRVDVENLRLRAYVGVGASATGAILVFFGGATTLPGLFVLGAGLLTNIVVPKKVRRLRQARSQADSSWRAIQDAWAQQSGNQKFLEIKKATDELVRSLADLPNEGAVKFRSLNKKNRKPNSIGTWTGF